jgi:hypothetical protein
MSITSPAAGELLKDLQRATPQQVAKTGGHAKAATSNAETKQDSPYAETLSRTGAPATRGPATTPSETRVRLVPATARCAVLGESHGRARFTDAQVARARRLRASGWTLREVAAAVGCSVTTAWEWTAGGGRPAPARIVVKVGGPRRRCAEAAARSALDGVFGRPKGRAA